MFLMGCIRFIIGLREVVVSGSCSCGLSIGIGGIGELVEVWGNENDWLIGCFSKE